MNIKNLKTQPKLSPTKPHIFSIDCLITCIKLAKNKFGAFESYFTPDKYV